ncbi:S9 family peptidase [Brachybacterium alimentarium]|uniref:S9 family peptidase n=1 Tax=Brachybacterium alimentarium TaxID=47845 RepID=A0A2A3YD86_9MICO|nr:S9 family peptidase [Brachybacterium alimentarium]PCC37732.1 S9 family peptidase [Brachybacterium alimentarium]
MSATSTITVEDLLRPPERSGITISPDGARLAYLSMWHERLNIWVEEIDADTAPRCVTADESRSIVRYLWADDSRHLLYQQDSGGDENWHVFRIDLDDPGAPAVDLTPFPGATVQKLELRVDRPGHATLQLNAENVTEFDLYDLEITTGTLTRLAPSPGEGSTWMLVGETLLRRSMRADGTWELWRGETLLATFDGDAYPMDVYPFEAAPDGTGIWFGSYRGTDHLHPARLDLATGEETMIHHHPQADMDTRPLVFTNLPSPLIRHGRTGELLGVRYHGMRMHTHPLDSHFAEILEAVGMLCDGDISTLTSDDDQRRWVVTFLHDRDPQTWFYDHESGRSRLLARNLEHLNADLLAPVESIEITARDGLRLPAYLTLPAHEEPRDLPLVLMPHGGPWTRDWWRYDSIVQLWANRGYAVLQPQFRGSAGFGRRHMEAGVGEFAGRMHDDLIDAVDWAIAQGYADPERIGVFGGSYGGYAALVSLAFTPDRFAAAVEYVGVSDLVDYLRSLPEYARSGLVNNWYRYVGDPSVPEQAADMSARSPITRVGDIRAPLMVVQGANDVRVRRENSDRIVAGLRERGNDVEYLVFDDEGHFIINPENVSTLYHAADQFFARHLAKVPATTPAA